MNKKPVWLHKNDFENSTILKEEYFNGMSQASVLTIITHTYDNNIVGMRECVGKYIGHVIHPNTHHSKIREAYIRIKQPKFVTVKEISRIIK